MQDEAQLHAFVTFDYDPRNRLAIKFILCTPKAYIYLTISESSISLLCQGLSFSCKNATSCQGRQPLYEKTQYRTCLHSILFPIFSTTLRKGSSLCHTATVYLLYHYSNKACANPIHRHLWFLPETYSNAYGNCCRSVKWFITPIAKFVTLDFITSLFYPFAHTCNASWVGYDG